MKKYIIHFTAALILFSLTFLLLDYAIMNLQGLSLIFHG